MKISGQTSIQNLKKKYKLNGKQDTDIKKRSIAFFLFLQIKNGKFLRVVHAGPDEQFQYRLHLL